MWLHNTEADWDDVLEKIKMRGATLFVSKIQDLSVNGYAGEFTSICGQAFKKNGPCELFGLTLERLIDEINAYPR